MVLALDTGGRWSSEVVGFLEELAVARARTAPRALHAATVLAWQKRWARLLGTAAARNFARSLVVPAAGVGSASVDGVAPSLQDLLARGF